MPDQGSGPLAGNDGRIRGEPAAPTTPAEARHWIRLYQQIITFEETMLGQMRELQRTLPDGLREEAENSNIRPMEQLIAGYRERAAVLEDLLISLMPDEEGSDSPPTG